MRPTAKDATATDETSETQAERIREQRGGVDSLAEPQRSVESLAFGIFQESPTPDQKKAYADSVRSRC